MLLKFVRNSNTIAVTIEIILAVDIIKIVLATQVNTSTLL